MCQCANTDEVHTLLGIVADSVVGYSPTRLCLVASGNNVYGLFGIADGEVVEHYTVDTSVGKHLVELVEVTYLNLYFQVKALLLQVGMASVDGIGNASGKVNMVVLEEYHVEESYAVVYSSTNLHCLLLKHAQSWSGFAGIENASIGTL